MGERIRAHDWARTPLGPIERWSPSLKMMVRFLLANRFPMLLWWGPEFIQIYNDPYRPILGAKHPSPGLGQPVSVCWSEIWDVLRPLIETPFQGGAATWMDDILLQINRHGFDEETHFTIAYSPVPDDSVPGGIGGVLATVNEITEKVVAQRRVSALRDLGARAGEAKTAAEACRIAVEVLARHDKDIPFAIFYLVEPDGARARLAGASGTAGQAGFSPEVIDLGGPSAGGWPAAEALAAGALQVVPRLREKFAAVPAGPWPDPPDTAVVLPISSAAGEGPVGVMIAGVSSRLRLDPFYRDFLELVRAQVAAAIANAHAYEGERRRAESLAELDRAKTEFFSNISHEFRTPLTLMLGPLEEALQEAAPALSGAARARLEVVHRNGLRLLKLVNTLLDFSRIEAGRMQAEFAPVDLAVFTADLASVFRSAIEDAGLRLTVDCPALPREVAVDRDMWEKIVLNLLSNAFKYTLAGGIGVALEPVGDGVRLTVSDTGVGIPEAELPRVFERFHRVRNARGRTHEGTGIGLALVQELVHLHGGTIRVESAAGRGTSFVVEVPAGAARPELPGAARPAEPRSRSGAASAYGLEAMRWIPAHPAADAAADAAGEGPDGARPERPRILCAEDNADMRDYLRRLLAESFEVATVADGQAALEAIRARPPELVLSDVMMPRLDGFGLLREMRADPALAGIPVILLSARAGEEARVGGVGSGADDYLTKPFSARELVARVDAHIRLLRIRRSAEAASRESEERLRQRTAQFETLLNQAPLGVYVVDSDLRMWEMNPLAAQIFQGAPSPMGRELGELMRPLIGAAEARQVTARFRRTLETGESWAVAESAAASPRGGAAASIEWRIDRIPLPDGRFGVVCYFRDISAQVRARDEALAANRAKDEFLAMLSHELRTPLNPVLLIASEAAADETLPAPVRANFRTIADNVALQARLVDDLLDLNCITRGKVALERQALDLHGVLRSAVETVGEDIRGNRIELTLEFAAPRSAVEGDPVRLRQVFWNVLKNAVKFTPGGGRITIASSVPHGGREIEVRIQDSGIGMEPDELSRVFYPFVQGRHAAPQAGSGSAYGGLGLGLAISRTLIEAHGGTILAESAGARRGSAIVIRLPLRERSPAAGAKAGPDGAALARPAPAPPARHRILFVEDHAPTRTAMARLLTKRGYDVTPAQSVAEALAYGRSGPFDALISDLGLPDGDGCKLMAELRRGHEKLPGIAISGYGMEEDLSRSRAAGFGDHLTKPISVDSLERALERLLADRFEAAAEGRRQPAETTS